MSDKTTKCAALCQRTGQPCNCAHLHDSPYCFVHSDRDKAQEARSRGGKAKAARPWYQKHKLDSKEDLGDYLHAALIEATTGGLTAHQAEAIGAVAPALVTILPSSRTSEGQKPATPVLGASTGNSDVHE